MILEVEHKNHHSELKIILALLKALFKGNIDLYPGLDRMHL
jgi:hypothetical protein